MYFYSVGRELMYILQCRKGVDVFLQSRKGVDVSFTA